jgi:hypothetical protein
LLPLISRFSAILPIIFFLIFLKRNEKGGLWVIFIYCIISFTTDLVSKRLAQHIPPFYLYSFFSIIEYTLFAIFLFLSYKQKNFKNILLLLSLLFYGVVLSNLFRNNTEMQNFDSPSASFEAILIIVYGIFFLFEQIKDPSIFYIYYLKKFWIVLAFLIYFSSTLFLFLYAATFARPEKGTYWIINNIFDIIKNLLFVVSFTMMDKKQEYVPENLYNDM